MVLPLNNGSVFQYRSKNNFKESWLCLEPDGKLTWKRVDAYQIKGFAYVDEVFDKISIGGWSEKQCSQNKGRTPFLIRIPIAVQGSKSMKTLMVMNVEDLNSWLDAFATVLGKWKLWRNVKRRHATNIAAQVSVDESSLERVLSYEELVSFYSETWKEFLVLFKERPGDEESLNSHPQNGTISHYQNGQNGTVHLINGSSSNEPLSYDSADIKQNNGSLQQEEHTVIASVHEVHSTVSMNHSASVSMNHTASVSMNHTAITVMNGQIIDDELSGEEDSGDEMRF